MFGSALIYMSDNIISLLESSQQSMGIGSRGCIDYHQTFLPFSYGWMRLERLVEDKKLLFIRSIQPLDDDVSTKLVFVERSIFSLLTLTFAGDFM